MTFRDLTDVASIEKAAETRRKVSTKIRDAG